MRFKLAHEDGHSYFVGTSKEQMTEDAKLVTAITGEGEVIDVERVMKVMSVGHDDPQNNRTWRDFLDAGVNAAKQGCKSHYLFSG